jgi:hypothetical protein
MKLMIRFEMKKKEKIMILFEVQEIFLDEILFDEHSINREEDQDLKIYFLNFEEIQEVLRIHKVLIFEIYFEIFQVVEEELLKKNHQNKNHQNKNLLT